MRLLGGVLAVLMLGAVAVKADASSYSQCRVLAVVEDVYFNKMHVRILRFNELTTQNTDYNYQQCNGLVDKVVALYESGDDAPDEHCHFKFKAGFQSKKWRNRIKDNMAKGDMVKLDYVYHSTMTPAGPACMKDWQLVEHVPLNKHAR